MKKTKSTVNTPQLLTLRRLATSIGVDVGLLSRESKRPGFPSQKIKGKTRFDPAAVIAWRQSNIRQRKLPDSAPANPAAESPQPTSPDDAALLEILTAGTASALEVTRAAAKLAARRIAAAFMANHLGPTDLDALKKTLGELRAAESAYLELEKQKRDLIPRPEVAQIITAVVARLTRCLSAVENSIATEFSLWLADPKMSKMSGDERARTVRNFVARTTADARRLESENVQALIDSAARDE